MSKLESVLMVFVFVAMFFGGMFFAGTWIISACEANGIAYFNGETITCQKVTK